MFGSVEPELGLRSVPPAMMSEPDPNANLFATEIVPELIVVVPVVRFAPLTLTNWFGPVNVNPPGPVIEPLRLSVLMPLTVVVVTVWVRMMVMAIVILEVFDQFPLLYTLFRIAIL